MRFTNRIILILWAIACGPLAACSDGGTEAPGPENGTQTIVWTPAVPVRDAAVVFSLEGSPDNVRSVLWMFGDGATATSGADESAEHTYRTAGTYTVRATVTRLHGPMTELSATVALTV